MGCEYCSALWENVSADGGVYMVQSHMKNSIIWCAPGDVAHVPWNGDKRLIRMQVCVSDKARFSSAGPLVVIEILCAARRAC